MHNAELLAMLSARSPRLEGVAGAIARLRPLDIAGALGMAHVRPGPCALILAKYAGDGPARHTLFAHWFEDRLLVARRGGWNPPRPRMVETLCTFTISENLLANRCGSCDGTGFRMEGARRVNCATCDATGFRYWGDRRIAKLFGLGVPAYAGTWRPRLLEARAELQRWELEGLEALGRGLRSLREK